jgi:plastocyanin
VTRTFAVAGRLLVAGLAALGCTDDSGNGNPGTGGSSAGAAGTGGTTGAAGSGGGGGASGGTGGSTPGFMSIAPCRNESDYMAATTVTFPVSATDFNYAPKCLHLSLPDGGPGMDVTFTGDFVAHPLEPSALRGAQSGNPITATSAGTSKVFRFSTPGFFAYFCETHNPSDNGAAMSGVVWVTQQGLLP